MRATGGAARVWYARGGRLLAGGWTRALGGGVAVSSAASVTVLVTGKEERQGLAKVGRGARGASGAAGRGQRWGPQPARRGRAPGNLTDPLSLFCLRHQLELFLSNFSGPLRQERKT